MLTFTTVAYLDPGAGSLLLQAVVAGGAGFMVLIKHLWRTYRAARG